MASEKIPSPLPARSALRRHPLDAIVDRPRGEAALAVTAAWVAFMAGMLVGGEVVDLASFAIAGASGAALVWLGFAAASRCRTLPAGPHLHPARLVPLSLAAGAGVGLANLAANRAIAAADPSVRVLLAERFVTIAPLDAVFVAPVVEEVAVRLFLLSAIAWAVSRFTKRPRLAFAVALVGSAFVFALLHLDRPMPADPVLASYYRAALVAKYTVLALPLGWIFWRWGLPYAVLCHAAINAAHFVLQDVLF
jgi:membrane protease YdiL (CAAX protease family)